MSWPRAEPAPRILVLPPDAADLGEAEAAIELWEHYSRKTLDEDQRLAVLVMMAQTGNGRWAAQTTGREKTRQNGKGDEVEVVELWGLVQRAEAILHTVHDAVMLSTQTQQRMLGVLEGHADLRRRVGRVWKGTGQQMIEMRNGGTIWYRTRTAKGGLGVDDVDRLVVDEAQEATEEHIAAVSPTLLANANPQMNALGTAGKTGVSKWWWSMRRRALGPDPGAFGYIGTTAERVYLDDEGRVVQEPVDVEDRSLWLEVNPAIRAGRGQGMDFLEEQKRRMGDPRRFAREHLCVWDPPDDEGEPLWQLFDEVCWKDTKVPAGEFTGPHTYAVEVTPDRDRCSVAAAGLHGDRVGVETLYAGPYDEADVLSRLVKIAKTAKGIVIEAGGPANTLIRPLRELHGIEPVEVTAGTLSIACQSFYDAHRSDLAHTDDDPDLDAAVASATRKKRSDGWYFDRARDVTPLTAAALARWGHLEIETPVDEGDFIAV